MEAVRERIQRVADAPAPVIVLGRDRNRQGSRRAGSPRGQPARRPCVRIPQLRGVAGAVAGERALRVRQGRLHGRRRRTGPVSSPKPTAAPCSSTRSGRCHRPAGQAAPRARERHRPTGRARHKQIEVDVRIIAATHRNLGRAVREGTFREDLLYRLDVVSIVLPPLRDRRDDIPELLEHFLAEARRNTRRHR